MLKHIAVVAIVVVGAGGFTHGLRAQQQQGSEQTLLSRVASQPDDIAAQLELVKIYLSSNRLAEAEQQLTRALMVVRQQRMQAGQGQRPGVAQGAGGGQTPLRVGGAIKEPKAVRAPSPVYPPEAQAAGVQGIVILEAVIGTDGLVTDAKVLRSVPLLDAAAVDAVRQWEYTPTLLNGQPVPVVMTVTVNFSLR